MNEGAVDRIRSASFSLALKGYDRGAVDRFLDDLADWIERGGPGDEENVAAEVRRELERVGESTAAILTEAHDVAESLRADAERRVRQQLAEVNIRAEALQGDADEYAESTRESADTYALKTRADADAAAERARIEVDTYSEETKAEAEGYATGIRREAEDLAARVRREAEEFAAEARKKAEAQAKQIVDEANRRRKDVEKVISDLEGRREAVVAELRRLASDVAGAAGEQAAENGQQRAEAVTAAHAKPSKPEGGK